jgi:putative membrane protein
MMDAELNSNERLAEQRTAMAADRTLMAWVRTSTSLISFGFTIYKAFHTLLAREAQEAFRPHGIRHLSLFLIFMGTLPLLLAMLEHWHVMRLLGKSPTDLLASPSFLLGSVMSAFGLLLFGTILVHVELF